MQEKIAALKSIEVWRVTKPSPGVNALHSKWVFKTKTGADGELERYKARLVACGNEQVLGIHYNLTFAAVMDISTAEAVLALAATRGRLGAKKEPIRAEASQEPLEPINLYSTQRWGVSALLVRHVPVSQARRRRDIRCRRLRHDLLSTGTSVAAVEKFFLSLASMSIKDLGHVNKYLGTTSRCWERRAQVVVLPLMRSSRSSGAYCGSRDVRGRTLILQSTKRLGRPMLLGCSNGSSPSVSRARSLQRSPTFADDKADRKSLTLGVVLLNGMAMSCNAKKQGGVGLLTMEADFVATSEVAPISHIQGEASSIKDKHTNLRHKFMRDLARRGIVTAQHVRSELMIADMMTKALDAIKLVMLRSLMRLQ
ncbi:unnamed protein product [Peronospora effusa]|nr:unnamed protein product [Peronospora effusa]